MKVHKNIKSDKKTIAQLCEVLLSDEMYLCQPLYNLLSAGLESGKMRGITVEGPTPLQELLSNSHEAHFRLELVLALSCQAYRHAYTAAAMSKRAREFEKVAIAVKSDRTNHGAEAWRGRYNLLNTSRAAQRNVEDDDDDEDAERTALAHDPCLSGAADISTDLY